MFMMSMNEKSHEPYNDVLPKPMQFTLLLGLS